MRLAWRLLFFMLCLNIGTWMVSETLGFSVGVTQADVAQLEETFDADKIVETWNWPGTGSLIGDIGSGLRFFWGICQNLVMGFPLLLGAWGTPPLIVSALVVLWSFIWVSFIIDFISGRRMMG